MINKTSFAAGALVAVGVLGLVACGELPEEETTRETQLEESKRNFDKRTPPQVTGDAEYQNYIRAQEDVYDNPANIIWCTASFPNTASPIFTVPIAGKLTSSSVSYYPNHTLATVDVGESWGQIPVEAQSVDGMYHGTPGPYRYGFTPGGMYVDYTGMAVFCTTALTEFQRQSLSIAEVSPADAATSEAEAALEAGDPEAADEALEGLGE